MGRMIPPLRDFSNESGRMIKSIREFEKLGGRDYVVGMFDEIYYEFDDLHRSKIPPSVYVKTMQREKFGRKFDTGGQFAVALWFRWPFVANDTIPIIEWAEHYTDIDPYDFSEYISDLMDM